MNRILEIEVARMKLRMEVGALKEAKLFDQWTDEAQSQRGCNTDYVLDKIRVFLNPNKIIEPYYYANHSLESLKKMGWFFSRCRTKTLNLMKRLKSKRGHRLATSFAEGIIVMGSFTP